MAQMMLRAEKREKTGKGPNRRLRAAGRIPGIVYGRGMETLQVSVNPVDVVKILTSGAGRNTIFTLSVNGLETNVLIRDFQLHPVKGSLIHVDFQQVTMDEKMIFEVPVEIVGSARGVKAGGLLDQPLRRIELECLPRDVPNEIVVDVSELDMGAAVRVSDLQLDRSKLRVLTEPDVVVVTVLAPRVEAEVEAAPAEVAEPEVIRRGKVEEAEEGQSE